MTPRPLACTDRSVDMPKFVENLISKDDPYAPFLPLLSQSSNNEDPIPLLTSSVLSSLLSHGIAAKPKQDKAIDRAIPQLYTCTSKLCKSSDPGFQDIGVQEYSALLRAKRAREMFWEQRKDTVNPLMGILRNAAGGREGDSSSRAGGSIRSDIGLGGGVGLQLLYHVLLVIWQLSFEATLVGPGLDEYVLMNPQLGLTRLTLRQGARHHSPLHQPAPDLAKREDDPSPPLDPSQHPVRQPVLDARSNNRSSA